ncbi:MAG: ANTAR domain-containing response regulator [Anaerolineae bacterium]
MEATSLRIIIADDEAVIRMGLKTMVRALGHTVVATARNGDEAIARVKQLQPDLLLLDIKMPGLDGLTVAKTLAEENPLPVVMLTAYSQKKLIEEAVAAPVMGYLVKPVDEAKLAPALEMAVTGFKDRAAAAAEATRLKQRLDARNLIARARQLLMAQGITEAEAYHRLQAAARRRQISLAEQAKRVINRGKIL